MPVKVRSMHAPAYGVLRAKVFGHDGKLKRDLGVISADKLPGQRMWSGLLPIIALLLCFAWVGWRASLIDLSVLAIFSLITVVGVQYEAIAFASGPGVGAINYHDSGTGATAPTINDTALTQPTGNARVLGTQTNPLLQVYQTVAQLPYAAAAPITEWGIWTASVGGSLWDHRVFPAIEVEEGDKIEFTYDCLFSPGGI